MTAIYKWYESYKAALLETDWSKMSERIQAAEAALSQRKRELSWIMVVPQKKIKLSRMP